MIGHIFFGLLVGIVARWIFPGHNPGGFIVTILLGMAGAWVGGALGRAFGWYPPGHPAGFFMAVVGALLLLFAYHSLMGNGTRRRAGLRPVPVRFNSVYHLSQPVPLFLEYPGY